MTLDPRLPQRLSALERANEIRLARAELRRRIARGEIFPARVLLDVPEAARTWELADLLASQWRWGTSRAARFCARNMVSQTKPVGALTERQRRLIAGQLGAGASPGGGER